MSGPFLFGAIMEATKAALSPSGSRITHAIAPDLSAIPDGTYRAHQTGHEVRCNVPINTLLFAEREIVGDVECVVEAKDGVVTVRDYRDSEHEGST